MKLHWPEKLREAIRKAAIQEHNRLPDNRRIFNEIITTKDSAKSWKGFESWAGKLQGTWVFRGQSSSAWDLETSLDRATILRYKTKFTGGIQRLSAHYEKPLLREFQRRAHQYVSHVPADDEIIDWLALMQHYGAPTRLLDWTRSPYVALFFAAERGISSRSSAIWAIHYDWLVESASKFLNRYNDTLSNDRLSSIITTDVNKALAQDMPSPPVMIAPVDPKRMNERMAAQQSVLLCNLGVNLDHHVPFDIAILTMIIQNPPENCPIRKLNVSLTQRISMLDKLRTMNITAASLFPGLEGFMRSLVSGIEIKMAEDKLNLENADEAAMRVLFKANNECNDH